jgi:predicted enzyme related to lactoylglutathione lyase
MGPALRIELFPADAPGVVDFYRRVLRFSARSWGGDGYTTVWRGDVRIGISPRPAAVDPTLRRPPVGVEIVLEVDDLDEEFALVQQSGWPIDAPIVEQPWGLRDFRIVDPEGYYLRITHV